MSDRNAKTAERTPAVPASYAFSPEDRATMFIEWCALKRFGLEGWPTGAYDQLVNHLKEIRDGH